MKKISLLAVTLFAIFAFVAISSSVANAQDVACPAGYTCTPIVTTQVFNCPAGYVCTPTNVQNLGTNTDCGFIINNISPKSRVNFPLKVEGTIDNSTSRSCHWRTFEGQVGTAQLYYNYNGMGWKAIGQSSIVKITTDNQTKISFATSLNFNNEGIGLPPGTPMKIVFNDENPSGLMNSSHTFELPIVLAGNITSTPSPTPTSFPPLPIVTAPCLSLSNNLQIGNISDDVSLLHNFLIAKGYSFSGINSGASPKNYFGLETQKAVMEYQKSVGLPNTGFVGPLTRGVINGLCGNNTNSVAVIRVTAPIGGQIIKNSGSNVIIGWKHTADTNHEFGINLLKLNGDLAANIKTCSTPSNKTQESGSLDYSWKNGYDAYGKEIPNGRYNILVYDCAGITVSGQSANSFELISGNNSLVSTPTPSPTPTTTIAPVTPKISINSPKQGETWNIGETKTISWNYQNFDSSSYGNKYVDVMLVPSDGREPVKLGANMSAPYNSIPVKIYEKTTDGRSAWLPGTYKVRVACQNTNAASFNSCYSESGYFSVISPTPSPSPTAGAMVR